MNLDDKLVDFLKSQIEIENIIVDSLNKSLSEMGNPAVKGVLKGISLDSVKHAEMYASAVNLLTSVPQALTQENLDKQRELVEKHNKAGTNPTRLFRKILEEEEHHDFFTSLLEEI